MKKYLFSITAFIAVSSLNAQAIVGIVADTDVKVKSNTLLYVGGKMVVDNYTTTGKKVSNEGNIYITGSLNNGSSTGKNFVEEYVGTGSYGQLIIKNDGASNKASGKITSVVKKPQDNKFAYLPLALPYSGINTSSIVKELFNMEPSDYYNYNGGGAYSDTRYKAPLFFFNNQSYTVDDLTEDASINPTHYYMVDTKYNTTGAYGAGAKASLTGVPNNKKEDLVLNKYHVAINTGINKYGEAYGSYISDWTVTQPEGWTNYNKASGKVVKVTNKTNYGDNIFQFGNPYTSNIDLSKGFFGGISGKYSVMQRTSTTFNVGVKDGGKPSTIPLTMYYTSDGTGDKNALFVRPFQSFQVKMIDEADNYTFSFSDALKTFSFKGDAVNVMYNRKANNKPAINQVKLNLMKNEALLGSVYVVASNIYKASQEGEGIEVYNHGLTDDVVGIYTLQETKDGLIDESLSSGKTYINGVNSNYVGKPIHLVIQNGQGEYTLKAELNKDLINSGKSFYIKNSKTDETKEIGKDFTYKINVSGTDKDTYILYWANTPSDKILDKDLAKESVSETKIYRDADKQYKVRFGNDIKNPSVFVYNISGQLVNVTRKVSTVNEYTIPLNTNATVYIVKIVGTNGKVVTKKIIK